MKKILKILSLFTINGLLIANSVACSFPDPNHNTPPFDPGPTPKKDINDYNQDIKNLNIKINNINNELSNWNSAENKKTICGSVIECKVWKIGKIMYHDSLNDCNAQVKEDYYQILLLENNGDLSPETKKVARRYLKDELGFLQKRLKLLKDQLVIDDTKSIVVQVNKQIDLVNQNLNNLK